jgi:hypothetical protein
MTLVGLDAEPAPGMVTPGHVAIILEATPEEAREAARLFGEQVTLSVVPGATGADTAIAGMK